MSRNPKHSPPGSPQLSRRTPQLQYSTNSSESLYATQTPLPPLPPPTTTHNINGNLATHTNISLSSMDGAPTEVTPAPKSSSLSCKNGATSRSAMSNSSSNAPVVSKSLTKVMSSGEDLLKELKAPPLPPRKASNNNNNSSNESNGLNHSSENITVLCEFDVPRTTAPPIPKHQTPPPITSRSSIDQITHELQQHTTIAVQSPPPLPNHHTINDQDVETVIVGPAETISGIIDTRPISHRKPISASAGGNEQQQQQLTNNLYHMKNATSSPTMHVRNASLPVNNTSVPVRHTAETLPKPAQPKPPIDLPPEIIRPSSQQRTSGESHQRPNSTPHTGSDHFLYENMTLTSVTTTSAQGNSVSTTTTTMKTSTTNSLSDATSVCSVNTNHLTGKDCDNVPYENINLDYITRLMNEGYSKENVITALGK